MDDGSWQLGLGLLYVSSNPMLYLFVGIGHRFGRMPCRGKEEREREGYHINP